MTEQNTYEVIKFYDRGKPVDIRVFEGKFDDLPSSEKGSFGFEDSSSIEPKMYHEHIAQGTSSETAQILVDQVKREIPLGSVDNISFEKEDIEIELLDSTIKQTILLILQSHPLRGFSVTGLTEIMDRRKQNISPILQEIKQEHPLIERERIGRNVVYRFNPLQVRDRFSGGHTSMKKYRLYNVRVGLQGNEKDIVGKKYQEFLAVIPPYKLPEDYIDEAVRQRFDLDELTSSLIDFYRPLEVGTEKRIKQKARLEYNGEFATIVVDDATFYHQREIGHWFDYMADVSGIYEAKPRKVE